MLTAISSYTEPASVCTLVRGDAIGYRSVLNNNKWFLASAQTQAWLGTDDVHPCSARWVLSVDVLPPATSPSEYRSPVFLVEARKNIFAGFRTFGRGELLRFLFRCCFEGPKHLCSSPHENILLLEDQQIAVVHWLPAYGCWQLHVRGDLPYMVNPGTRIFALQ